MSVAEKLVNTLKKKGWHISTGESCTGGMVASLIVDVEGASMVFEEGYVTYSNRVKEKLLNVSEKTILKHTVVSEEVASEMAFGVHEKTGSEITISVTGYAGPYDACDGTKAGTVYIGTYYNKKVKVKKYLFNGDRKNVREQAAIEALAFALERITKGE